MGGSELTCGESISAIALDIRETDLFVRWPSVATRSPACGSPLEATGKTSCHMDVATEEVHEGEIGCLFDEIQNLIVPIERRTMEGPAGPQPGKTPERSGRSRAFDSPVPGEGRVSRMPANVGTWRYWPSAAKQDAKRRGTERPGRRRILMSRDENSSKARDHIFRAKSLR